MKSRQEISPEYFGEALAADGLGRTTVKAGAITMIAQVASLILSTGSNIVLARLLSPEDFGLIAMVAPVAGFLAFFRDMGLSAATVQQVKISHEQTSTLFWLNVALSLALMLFTVGLAPMLGWFYKNSEIFWLMLAYGLNFIVTGVAIQHVALLRRKMKFVSLAKMNIISAFAGFLGGILGAYIGLGYWALVLATFSNSVCGLVLTYWYCQWVPGPPVLGSGIRKMVAFGGYFTGSNLLSTLSNTLESFFIGHSLGAGVLGHYNRAYILYLLPIQQVIGPLANVAVPVLSQLQTDPDRYRRAFLKMAVNVAIITTLVASIFVVVGDQVLLLLMGPQWMEAAGIVRVLAVGGLITPISAAVSWLLVTQGRTKELFRWSFVSITIKCAALVIGLKWGIKGVSISVVMAYFMGFVLFSALAGQKGSVSQKDMLRSILGPFAAASVSIGAGLYCRHELSQVPLLPQVLVVVSLCSGVMFAILWMIPSSQDSIKGMIQLLRHTLQPHLQALRQNCYIWKRQVVK